MVDHVPSPYVHDLSVNYVSGGHPLPSRRGERERDRERTGRVPRSVLIIRKLFAGRHVGPSGELELVASRPYRVPDRNNIGDVRVGETHAYSNKQLNSLSFSRKKSWLIGVESKQGISSSSSSSSPRAFISSTRIYV